MTDKLANDMLHAAGHAHMDIAGQYDAPAMRKAIGAALRVLAERDWDLVHWAPMDNGADDEISTAALADRIEHPAEEAQP